MEEDFKPRIKNSTAVLMIFVSFFYDALQALINLIPIAGQILAYGVLLLSAFHLFVWFKIHDVGFLERFGAKKIMAYIAVPIIEILTVGIAPGITIATGITIAIVKSEDALIKAGLISREDLRMIESFVLRAGKVHGFDSPEFKHALSGSLKKEVEKRYANPEAKSVITNTVNKQIKTGSSEEQKNNASSQQEISNLKKDIQRAESELQQLRAQKTKADDLLKSSDELAETIIRDARERDGEERARKLSDIHYNGRAVAADKAISLSREVRQKENYIFSLKSKLSGLERRNTSRGQAKAA